MTTWVVKFSYTDWDRETETKTFEVIGERDRVDAWLNGETIAGLGRPPVDPWILTSVTKKRGGKRPGAGGKGGSPATYGCKTKVVRVPVKIAELIPKLLDSLESLENIVSLYDERVEESRSRSNTGKPSVRYEKLEDFLKQLEPEIELIREINNRMK
jgi:hypothetical protein